MFSLDYLILVVYLRFYWVYNLHPIEALIHSSTTNQIMKNFFSISLTILLNFFIANALKNQGGNWEDDNCFSDNFGHLINSKNTSKIYPDDIMVKIEHRKYSSGSGTSILSKRDRVLKKDVKTVFEYYSGAIWPFTEIRPRNLTLYFDGSTVYGGIGKLHDSYSSFSGSKRKWEGCQIGTSDVTKGSIQTVVKFGR